MSVVRIHPPQPIYIMENILHNSKSKYGSFIHFTNDDPIGACLNYYGEWAQPEFDMFDMILNSNSSVIDVGANIGTHSVYFAKKCNQGSVIAIEPQIYIFEILAANLLFNGCYNTIPVHAGVSSKQGNSKMVNISPFGTRKCNYGEFKINNHQDRGVDTSIVTLDNYCDFKKFDLIKMDVEGMEVNVLEGATKLIKEQKPILYIEFNNKNGDDKLLEKIYSLGYLPFWHIYPKHNINNHNKQEVNIWEPYNYIIDKDNLDLRYEGNALCVHKDNPLPSGLKRIELGESITSQLIAENLI